MNRLDFRSSLLTKMLLILAAVIFLTDCTKENSETQGDNDTTGPSLNLEKSIVEVPAQGGTFSLEYELSHPVEGAVLSAEVKVDWIEDLDCSVTGQIAFTVLANEESARETEVWVSYPGLTSPSSFLVRQDSAAPQEEFFQMSVRDITCRSMIMTLIPQDKKMDYINFIIPKDTLEFYASNDDELFQFDMERFTAAAEMNNMNLTDFLVQMSGSGDVIDAKVEGMMPSIDYYMYAYGIDIETAERLTPVSKLEFRTDDVEMIEAQFDIDVQVDEFTASVNISAMDYSGWCYAGIFGGIPEDATYDEILLAMQDSWNHILELYSSFGVSVEQMLQEVAFQNNYSETSALKAGQLFYTIAFALDDEGLMCSGLSYESFRTGEAKPSDNIITIAVTDIEATTATATFTTLNEDPYVQIARPKSEFEGLGSDDEIMDYLLQTWYMTEIRGDYVRYLEMMEPDTEYLAVAFGYYGYTHNTELFKTEFKTQAASGTVRNMPSDAGNCRTFKLVKRSEDAQFFDLQPVSPLRPMNQNLIFVKQTAHIYF